MTDTPEWRRAARIVRRLSFGASGADIDAVLKTGIDTWLNANLTQKPPSNDPGINQTRIVTAPLRVPPTETASVGAKTAFSNGVTNDMGNAIRWWGRRMVAVKYPVVERITFGWHGIFSTSWGKVMSARMMLKQNETIRANALGDFRKLAGAMLVDPAMLVWLDGKDSTKAAPNENLAREFMELFALGINGGYTEADVRDGARALTGYRIDRNENVSFDKSAWDDGPKTVLGVTGALDVNGFCDAVLAAPGSAKFIATRWWLELASHTPPPADTLDRLVAAYGGKRDIAALIKAIVTDPAFMAAEGTFIQTPVEWYIGAMRALRVNNGSADANWQKQITALGMQPFAPPSVGGWPSADAWLTTATARTRLAAAEQLANRANLTEVNQARPDKRIEATAHLLGLPGFSDRTKKALTPYLNQPRKLVQYALISPEYMVI